MHTNTITTADRGALENLWGEAGRWVAATWTRLNTDHFAGGLLYHGVVFGLTPHGGTLGFTHHDGRITLHTALLDPRGADPWAIESRSSDGDGLGSLYAADVLLHEMVHVALLSWGVDNTAEAPHHNSAEWCGELVRITPQLGLFTVKAAPVKPRRVNGKVVRMPLDGYLSRDQMAHWPHSLRTPGYYASDRGRIRVPI